MRGPVSLTVKADNDKKATYYFWSQTFLGLGAEELTKAIESKPDFSFCKTCKNLFTSITEADVNMTKCKALVDTEIRTGTDKFTDAYAPQWALL